MTHSDGGVFRDEMPADEAGDEHAGAGSAEQVPTYRLSDHEKAALLATTSALSVGFARLSAQEQARIAAFAAFQVRQSAPTLSAAVETALDTGPIGLFDGLPVTGEDGVDMLLCAIMSLLRGGEIFQFSEQLGGQLIGPIRPRADGAPNSNASPEPFDFHTDDAIMPAWFRVEEISLLSISNPPGTYTGFVLLSEVIKRLSLYSREILFQPRFSIKAPNGFDFDEERWIDCVAIFCLDPQGQIEIAYPRYNTRPTWSNDGDARRALDELNALLEELVIDLYLARGQWIVWNNSQIVHRRGAIGDGLRLLWRGYIRRNCDAMRTATSTLGPIFSAHALLEACGIIKKEQGDVA